MSYEYTNSLSDTQGLQSSFPRMDPQCIDLITQMLQFDPSRRISASAALSHPFFNEIKQKGYLTTYQQNNQHTSDHGPVPLSVALNPVPMNADREKVGESAENLKINVSECLLQYVSCI